MGVTYGEKSNKLIQNRAKYLGRKKGRTLSDVCSSYQSQCAKCYVFGFESVLSRQSRNTYHVTALYKHMKEKITALQA